MKSNKRKKKPVVLVCPLSWGLGHASRCIPVISKLLEKDCNVCVAGSEEVVELLKKEFEDKASYFHFYSLKMSYGKNTFLNLLLQTPLFIYSSLVEHYRLNKLIRFTGADAVISDNRYGLWSKNVFTVFITHQLNIKLPANFSFLQKPLRAIIKKVIRKHNALWVPDNGDEINFAGELSECGDIFHPQTFYTGLLTRFSVKSDKDLKKGRGDKSVKNVLCIVSGPEPQRTFFEEKLISQLQEIPYNSVLLRGVPGNDNQLKRGKCIVHNHTGSKNFAALIANSDLIVCRSGYSTLMDLSAFGSKALLVPTPGQPEQEYLAGLFKERNWCYSVGQNKLNLKDDIEKALTFNGVPKLAGYESRLNEVVARLLNEIEPGD